MVRVSTLEVEAFRSPLTVNPEAKVEDACTRIPAEVLVGLKVGWPSMAICQEEPLPDPLPQAAAAADRRPFASVCTHRVPVPANPSTVKIPEAMVNPEPAGLVMALAEPIFKESVTVLEASRLVLTVSPEAKVEDALLWKVVPTVRVSSLVVVELRLPLIVNPPEKVEEAVTRIPAEVLVGERVEPN